MGYEKQTAWKSVEAFLPEKLHFTAQYHPSEEWWDWHGHRVHLDTFRNPSAKAKVILLHGVGTNGRQMSMIIGGPLSQDGFEVIALDMPLYGETITAPATPIRYDDWVALGSDYINHELARDDCPVFLYGLSAGGMETYHIACRNRRVKGIVGMTFLDQREPQVRSETTNNWFWAHIGVPLATVATRCGLGGLKMKMSICSKMSALCNQPECLAVMMNDPSSGGNSVPMRFIDSYMNAVPDIEPEDFTICPILLTQPEQDRWTPFHLSEIFLKRIKKVPVRINYLKNGGHYPVEQPALDQLHEYIRDFYDSILQSHGDSHSHE